VRKLRILAEISHLLVSYLCATLPVVTVLSRSTYEAVVPYRRWSIPRSKMPWKIVR